MPTVKHIDISHDVLVQIGSVADKLSVEAYVVGGYVRDKLLGKEVEDIDIVVIGDGIAFAGSVAEAMGKKQVVVYEKFGTAMIPLDGGKIEFVTARQESYEQSSRKPRVKPATLQSDLSRRDFAINTLAASINNARWGELVDLFEGEKDLREHIIRTPLDPEKTFDDDPLRMMRAIRFAAQLFSTDNTGIPRHFHIEQRTREAIGNMASRIAIVSKERVTDEFLKVLAAPKPSVGLKLLNDTGLVKFVFPELADMVGVEQRRDYHHKDVFLHTLKVVDSISMTTDNIWLRFVGLVHDIAKPRTKAFKEDVGWTFHGHEELGARMMNPVFRRMRLPLDRLPYVEKLVRLHLRPMVLVDGEVTDSAVRRLLFETGDAIDDLMLLCRADITSQNPQRVARYLKNYDVVLQKMKDVEEKDRLRNWQPPVRGDEIMEVCKLDPGPIVGRLKTVIEEAILEGRIPNEHDAALEYLLQVKDQVLQEKTQENV